MPQNTTTETPEVTSPPIVTPDPATRLTRAQQIRAIATTARLDSAWADSQVDSGADVTAVRTSAFEAMQRRAPNIRVQVGVDNTDPAVIRTRRVDALAARMGVGRRLPRRASSWANPCSIMPGGRFTRQASRRAVCRPTTC